MLAKKKKKKLAKSQIAFDVKVHNFEENFDDLYANIVKLVKDGLVWNQNFEELEVPDPYYGGARGFKFVLDLVEDASDGLLKRLKSA